MPTDSSIKAIYLYRAWFYIKLSVIYIKLLYISRAYYKLWEILYTLNFDKKILNNNINFILLNNIGNAYIEKNIDNKLIIESIKYIK